VRIEEKKYCANAVSFSLRDAALVERNRFRCVEREASHWDAEGCAGARRDS
jgi:hypothetical protein